MKQIIKKGIVFLLAVVMMTCQSSILSLAEEERKTTENTDNEEKEQKYKLCGGNSFSAPGSHSGPDYFSRHRVHSQRRRQYA